MADERKPVICPWCNTDSMGGIALDGTFQGKRRAQLYCGECGARSPYAEGKTIKAAIEAAYLAATATPPNLPLLLPDLFDLTEADAAWVVTEEGGYRVSEKKVVKCPWCGWDMVAREGQDIFHGKYSVYVCEACESCSPVAYSAEAAYLAATSTPPNPPLTLAELFTLDDTDAVWIVSGNGKIMAMGAECAQEWASEERCLFFAVKPTTADIEAARKDNAE